MKISKIRVGMYSGEGTEHVLFSRTKTKGCFYFYSEGCADLGVTAATDVKLGIPELS